MPARPGDTTTRGGHGHDARITIARRLAAGAALLAVAGCGGAAAGNASSSSGGSTRPSRRHRAPPSTAATVTGHGTVLVGGSNGMTLYMFDMDTPGSNTSACTGGCISTWPPLTVPAGTTPTAASGISGQLGTFTRADGQGHPGDLQRAPAALLLRRHQAGRRQRQLPALVQRSRLRRRRRRGPHGDARGEAAPAPRTRTATDPATAQITPWRDRRLDPRHHLAEHLVERGGRREAEHARAFAVSGMRRCTSCSNGVSET